ncbi:MAG: D-glycerate dehydrogenase [Chloroflexi bacterium]|nr:D-glycerate dehydrogenase [Chloroflexota bacterium]
MSKDKVFVTRELPPATLSRLRQHCDLEVWGDFLPPDYEIICEKAGELTGLLSLLTDRIDPQLMDAGPNLKVISNLAVGYDNIDIPAASQRGIPVGNTPGVLNDTTADFAFALMMAVARRIPEAQQYVKEGKWKTWHPTVLAGQDIFGSTLGLIGSGRIGAAVARRAQGFGMRLLVNSLETEEEIRQLGGEKVDLDFLLTESDFVSLHVPLTDETHHLISDRELGLMKPTAILINTARGSVLDPKALFTALHDGRILAAGLDVTDPEPIPQDDPLLTLDNCLIVPHIASASVATRTKMAEMAVDNVIAGLIGERLPTCVNPEVYDQP